MHLEELSDGGVEKDVLVPGLHHRNPLPTHVTNKPKHVQRLTQTLERTRRDMVGKYSTIKSGNVHTSKNKTTQYVLVSVISMSSPLS